MTNAYADGSDLAVADPNSGKRFTPGRSNPIGREKINEQLLEPAEIFMQILTASAQIDNRISHELSRPVISGLAVAIDVENGMRQMRSAQLATANPCRGGLTRVSWHPSIDVNRLMLDDAQL